MLFLLLLFIPSALVLICSYRLSVFSVTPRRTNITLLLSSSSLTSSSSSSSSSYSSSNSSSSPSSSSSSSSSYGALSTISALSKQEESQGSNIEVYSTIGCKYCRIAKAKLLELGLTDWIDFNINIYESIHSQENLSAISRQRILHARQNTVPQIYVGLHRIGGCDDLLGNYVKSSNNCKIFCVYNLTVYCSTLPKLR